MQDILDPTAAASAESPTRRSLLTKAMFTGLASLPVVAMINSSARATPGVTHDPQQPLDASSREAFSDIRAHENDHVAFLLSALGKSARPKPTFKGITTTSFNAFVELARVFEITGCGAYLGALPYIKSKEYVAAAGSIALIEGRHAGFLNVFAGRDVTTVAILDKPSGFEKPLTIAQVVSSVSPFIVSLNGGPAASFTAGDDTSILNFALLLEFLEAEFYNINIPKYFPNAT